MRPSDPIKLVSQLLDLPIVDKDERQCGIVDDIELSGTAGKETRMTALLVGPGAYEGRLPRWAFRLVKKIAGGGIVRVRVDNIDTIDTMVRLRSSADDAGLHVTENRVRRWIPRGGAL
jgi:sporulation protein YlmC with PRC-barrel domain